MDILRSPAMDHVGLDLIQKRKNVSAILPEKGGDPVVPGSGQIVEGLIQMVDPTGGLKIRMQTDPVHLQVAVGLKTICDLRQPGMMMPQPPFPDWKPRKMLGGILRDDRNLHRRTIRRPPVGAQVQSMRKQVLKNPMTADLLHLHTESSTSGLTISGSCFRMKNRNWVIATPYRTTTTHGGIALSREVRLRQLMLGTRNGAAGIPREETLLFPMAGLASYVASRFQRPFQAESTRYRIDAWFDAWVKRHIRPGDRLYSSFGFTTNSFKHLKTHGGTTILDGTNTHPRYFWDLLTEEHARWKASDPPVSHYYHQRSLEMMDYTDHVISPSSFVTQSFLENGFSREQVFELPYPGDFSIFRPATEPRPKNRPPRIITTGLLCLRKGTPYLLEAFRIIHKKHPSVEFWVTRSIRDDVMPCLAKYSDLPIKWGNYLPHQELAERYRQCDVFTLPSLEDGFARIVLEAMACGLPAVITPNTGAADYIQEGVSGSVVPIREPKVLAEALLGWIDRRMAGNHKQGLLFDPTPLKPENYYKRFMDWVRKKDL